MSDYLRRFTKRKTFFNKSHNNENAGRRHNLGMDIWETGKTVETETSCARDFAYLTST